MFYFSGLAIHIQASACVEGNSHSIFILLCQIKNRSPLENEVTFSYILLHQVTKELTTEPTNWERSGLQAISGTIMVSLGFLSLPPHLPCPVNEQLMFGGRSFSVKEGKRVS